MIEGSDGPVGSRETIFVSSKERVLIK